MPASVEALPANPRGTGHADAARLDQDGMRLTDYGRLIQRHKWAIIGLTLAGLIAGWLQALSTTPIYRAQLTLVIEPERANLTAIGDGLVLPFTYRFYETQYQILQSRTVAERVVDRLRLVDREPVVAPPVTRRRLGLSGAFQKIVKEYKQRLGLGDPLGASGKPASKDFGQLETKRSKLAALVKNGLSVSGGKESQIVLLSYTSPDPYLAAEVANAVARAYVDLSLEARVARSRQAGDWLTQQVEHLRGKVTESEAALQDFQAREGMVGLESLKALTSSKLETMNQELVRAQGKYAELAKRYGPKHPKMIAAKEDLDAARSRLQAESNDVVRAKEKEFVLAKLERDLATNRQLYDIFLQRLNETDLATDDKLSHASILDAAQVPSAPFKPDVMRIVSLWGLIGLLVGILFAYLREHLDNTFRSHEQVEAKLGRPTLGVLPLLTKDDFDVAKDGNGAHGERGAHVAARYFIDYGQSSFAESVNHIRTGILYSNVDDPPKVILISSSIQGEGKTTLATNLALSLSQLAPTLLVDADLRKLEHETSHSVNQMGLVELVAGAVKLQDCVTPDPDSKGLLVLQSGAIPPNPLELLSSRSFERLLVELRKQFSYVILDSAPVLPVSDAIVLGHLADAVLVVVQAERTTHALVRDGLRRFDSASVEPLGIVLSQLNQRKATYYYGRYQYYASDYYTSGSRGRRRAS